MQVLSQRHYFNQINTMDETTLLEHREQIPFPVFTFTRTVTEEGLPVKRGYKDDFDVYKIDFAPDSPGTDEQKRLFRAAVADFLPAALLGNSFRASGLHDMRDSERAHAAKIADRAIALLSDAEFQRKVVAVYREILALRSKVHSEFERKR